MMTNQNTYRTITQGNRLFQKKPKQLTRRRVEDVELPGVLEKEHVKIPGSTKKEVEFPGVFMKGSCGMG